MEKYIFLDFDGVLNTPKGKFDHESDRQVTPLVGKM